MNVTEAKETLEMAIYELARLKRVIEPPERGYMVNTFRSVETLLNETLGHLKE